MRSIDKELLNKCLAAAEKGGPLETQSALWAAAADAYNAATSGPRVTPSIVYHTVKRLGIAVQTPTAKMGRPTVKRSETLAGALESLETAATGWDKKNPGWEHLNALRGLLGLESVKPINAPPLSHFRAGERRRPANPETVREGTASGSKPGRRRGR